MFFELCNRMADKKMPLSVGGMPPMTSGAAEPPKDIAAAIPWIAEEPQISKIPTDSKEYTDLVEKIFGEITANKKTSPNQHIVWTVGSAGSGKSTVAARVVELLRGRALCGAVEDYVELDMDTFDKYHPDVSKSRFFVDFFGRETKIQYAAAWDMCTKHMEAVAGDVLNRVLAGGFSVILQSHYSYMLQYARSRGVRTSTLVYVHVPLKMAQARARQRAAKTGMFVGDTLKDNDRTVANLYEKYEVWVPYLAQWADELAIVNNAGPLPLPAEAVELVDPHQKDKNTMIAEVTGKVRKLTRHK